MITEAEKDRFWSRVNVRGQDECWPRTASLRDGYGLFFADGKNWRTHRLSWFLTFGPIPEGLCVLHKCDNRPCCNPRHHFLGTRLDNVKEMWAKVRQPSPEQTKSVGEAHGRAKLTRRKVRTMTEEETKAPILQVVADAGPEGIDEATCEKIVKWVSQARTDAAILWLFEKGRVSLHWDNEADDLLVKLREGGE